MNIVIGQDKYVRLTQYSNQAAYNLEDIVFYISKNLIQDTPQILLNSYPFTLEQNIEIQHEYYNIYSVIFDKSVFLSSRTYNIEIVIGAEVIKVGELLLNEIHYKLETPKMMTMAARSSTQNSSTYDLTDSNPPIDINIKTRTLTVPNDGEYTLISGDNISQVIRFRMPTHADGIDLSNKHIAIDYIPVGMTEIFSYYPEPETFETENQADGTSYVIIPWVIHNHVTAKAGTVKFALSVTDEFNYIWQTMPANLTVLQGLGRDFGVAPSVPTNITQNYVANIDKENNTFTVLSRVDGQTQEEQIGIEELLDGGITFSGGGATQ